MARKVEFPRSNDIFPRTKRKIITAKNIPGIRGSIHSSTKNRFYRIIKQNLKTSYDYLPEDGSGSQQNGKSSINTSPVMPIRQMLPLIGAEESAEEEGVITGKAEACVAAAAPWTIIPTPPGSGSGGEVLNSEGKHSRDWVVQ